jgi:hypothetical protein
MEPDGVRLFIELANKHLNPLRHAEAHAQIGNVDRLEQQVVDPRIRCARDRRDIDLLAHQRHPRGSLLRASFDLNCEFDAVQPRQPGVDQRAPGASLQLGS